MGFAGFAVNIPFTSWSLKEQLVVGSPLWVYLLIQITLLFAKKKTIGGLLTEKMKLSWIKTVLFIPVSVITIMIGGTLVSFIWIQIALLLTAKLGF